MVAPRPGSEVTVTTGANTGNIHDNPGTRARRRRGHRLRACVRQLHSGNPPRGRDLRTAAAHGPGLRRGLGCGATRDIAEDADDPRQHAEQPRHQRPVRGRPVPVRGNYARHGHRHRQRRGVRTHGLRRRAAREPRAQRRTRRAQRRDRSFGKTFHATGWKVGYARWRHRRSPRKSGAYTSSRCFCGQ